jgi:hypothetical protein
MDKEELQQLKKLENFSVEPALFIFDELQAMNRSLKELNNKDFSPSVTVEPVINVDAPEIKLPVITVPDVNVPETVVNIDTESLKTELRGIKDVVTDKPTVSNPMPVVLVFDEKEYKAEGGGKGGNVYGGGYSLATEQNTANTVTAINNLATSLGGGALTTLLDDVTTANVTYVGKAPVGSATSSAVWQVSKLDESGTPITLGVRYAGTGAFDQIYDNRSSLTYN